MNELIKTLLAACVLSSAACNANNGNSDGATLDDGGVADLAASYKYVGAIGALDDRFVTGGRGSSAFAAFNIGGTLCASHDTNGCRVSSCPTQAATPMPNSAGTITIGGGAQPVTLMPRANGSYVPFQDSTHLIWSGGQMLTVMATGDVVPAFSQTIVGPDSVSLTSSVPITIDRSRDLTVTWTAATNGEVEIDFFNLDPGGATDSSASCSFPASAGTATVSSAVLTQISTGKGSMVMYSKSEQTTVSGDWLVGLRLQDYAGTADGQRCSLTPVYQ
jgi:hypothetical protein